MSKKAYRLIFLLLTGSVLCILGIQAYWLYSSYLQKSEDFNRQVYDALEEVGTKLRDRRNLETLKLTYSLERAGKTLPGKTLQNNSAEEKDSLPGVKTKSPKIVVIREKKTRELMNELARAKEDVVVAHNMVLQVSDDNTQTIVSRETHGDGKQYMQYEIYTGNAARSQVPELKELEASMAHVRKQNKQLAKANQEMQELLNKMMSEVANLDTETHQADTVAALIQTSLQNRGIFIPFEFSLQKQPEGQKDSVLVQSKGFTEQTSSYKSDLSGSNIIPIREHLYVQFKQQKDLVMAGMQNSILLSLLFSALIISIFYYVLRLILKQKKLSDIKTDFINNMTHELKTPIATISLAVDAMNNPGVKADASRAADYSRILKEEAQKLNQHVERVLQVALLEKGELQLQLQALDLATLIRETAQHYQLQLLEKQATLTLDLPHNLPFTGDRAHLLAVFSNLLDNAIKYSPNNSPIHISARIQSGLLQVCFKDQGIGMTEAQQKRAFDTFYRAQGGNLHDVKGFGLGLSYTKSILEKHGARITVNSAPGKGSEFIITWPYTDSNG